MTKEEVSMVRDSFDYICKHHQNAASLFYSHLFKVSPNLRALFSENQEVQARKFLQSLAFMVANLDHPEDLLTHAMLLGTRHLSYGVQEVDYAVFGESLIWMLEQVLADKLTPGLKAAWIEAYDLFFAVMKSAARDAKKTLNRK